jgi:putative PIN family toxin of toxin-antitoxin system
MPSGDAESGFVIFDASVVVSAALTPAGASYSALRAARRDARIAPSPDVFQEIAGVLARPKFASALNQDPISAILMLLNAASVCFRPGEAVMNCRDSKDNRYLELGLAACDVARTVIVSGDDDLFVLDPWRGISILRPAAYLAMMAG